MAAASQPESSRVPRKSKGQITSEQLKATKSELMKQAQTLELQREAFAEKLAAASLAEQIQALRTEQRHNDQQQGLPATRGRPSSYNEDEAAALCQWITEGRSLRSWCVHSGTAIMTVYRWMSDRADFRERYARAHEDRADTMAEDIIDIADEVAGTESIAAVQAARLRIDTRKWVAAKIKPTKWGEKQVIENTGNVTFSLATGRPGPQTPVLQADIVGKPLISLGQQTPSGQQTPLTDCESVCDDTDAG